MIKNIIFDLGGVLLDIDLMHCMKQVQSLGVDFDNLSKETATIDSTTSTQKLAVMGEGIVATGATHLYQIGEISTNDFISGIQRLCHPGTTYQQVLDAWNTCCIDIPKHRLDKVLQLRQRGYNTYMLSNTNEAHWQDIVKRCFGGMEQVGKHFDKVFLSQEMHLAKPNDEIYLKVLEEIGADASECLFIDDSTQNIQAAAALGFNTIHANVSKTNEGKVVAPPVTEWKDEIDEVLSNIGCNE
ncbi:MAG: HAD family phosphatase [Prevotellaceae bacterium]|nr:HAD family phosphatase [Prevotellaceae bacterium]